MHVFFFTKRPNTGFKLLKARVLRKVAPKCIFTCIYIDFSVKVAPWGQTTQKPTAPIGVNPPRIVSVTAWFVCLVYIWSVEVSREVTGGVLSSDSTDPKKWICSVTCGSGFLLKRTCTLRAALGFWLQLSSDKILFSATEFKMGISAKV